MKLKERERLQKFYAKLSDQELKNIVSGSKDDCAQDVYELVKLELEKRESYSNILDKAQDKKRKYVNYISRGFSFLIDLGLVSVPLAIFLQIGGFAYLFSNLKTYAPDTAGYFRAGIGLVSILSFYYGLSFLIYGTLALVKWGATFGQRCLSLSVINYSGKKLTYKEALIRNLFFILYFIPYLGGALILVSIILSIVRPRKQMLHDLFANTLVLKLEKKIDFF